MEVPFLDLKRESERIGVEMEQAFSRVLRSGRYILGGELAALEAEFAEYLRVPFAIGVASGTDALTLALEATDSVRPGSGDEVITASLSAAFSALAIIRAGGVPRFADLDPATLQIDPVQIERLINTRTRAILPVHLYGHACCLPGILDLAGACHLNVIEDACQAHGSRLQGKALGTWGLAGAFSFYPTKNMGALGDAGMVVTGNPVIASRVKQLRNGGQSRTYCHDLAGCNSRLDEVQAAILRIKLARLEEQNEIRRRLADRYDEAFADLDLLLLPRDSAFCPSRHLYPVRTPHREALRGHLDAGGVHTLVHYPVPLPEQPALRKYLMPGQTFPVAEKAAKEILSLPLYPGLTDQEAGYTIEMVRRFFG
jgi:dTDP-3-amino-3,4,6-trideoxy-alpha-D-glucose transaminase